MRGSRGGILFILVVIAGIAAVIYLYSTRTEREPKRTTFREQQKDPEQAMWLYIDTANRFTSNDPKTGFDDVRLAITKDDWTWFQDHYKALHDDPIGLSTAIDPKEAMVIARTEALQRILRNGVSDRGEIGKREDGDDETTFTLVYRYDTGQGAAVFELGKVHLVMEGGRWKVDGFAGARDRLEQAGY